VGWGLLVGSYGQFKDELGSIKGWELVDELRNSLAAKEGLSYLIFVNRRILGFEHLETSQVFVFHNRVLLRRPLPD